MHPCHNFRSVAKCAKSRCARVNEYQMPTNYRRVGINHVMSRRPRLHVGEVLFKPVPRMHNDGSGDVPPLVGCQCCERGARVSVWFWHTRSDLLCFTPASRLREIEILFRHRARESNVSMTYEGWLILPLNTYFIKVMTQQHVLLSFTRVYSHI